MSDTRSTTERLRAAQDVDWMQVLLNLMNGQESNRDGQPCFYIDPEAIKPRFCLRAKFWAGHGDHHIFVSLADLIAAQPPAPDAPTELIAKWRDDVKYCLKESDRLADVQEDKRSERFLTRGRTIEECANRLESWWASRASGGPALNCPHCSGTKDSPMPISGAGSRCFDRWHRAPSSVTDARSRSEVGLGHDAAAFDGAGSSPAASIPETGAPQNDAERLRQAGSAETGACFTCDGEQGLPATRIVRICETCYGEEAQAETPKESME